MATLCFTVRNHKLVVARKPLPKLHHGWALIRVRLAGICNTDVEILRGYRQFRGTPGHEFVGEVLEVAGAAEQTQRRWLGEGVRAKSMWPALLMATNLYALFAAAA